MIVVKVMIICLFLTVGTYVKDVTVLYFVTVLTILKYVTDGPIV